MQGPDLAGTSDAPVLGVSITVVTIALNDLTGIKRTFKSLEGQTFRNVEHLIIDGGSTDGTAEWAAANSVFVGTGVVSEPDNGIYHAMNKGLRMATGDLVSFLNSGDQYADETVLEMVADSYSRERWPWAFGYGRMVSESGDTSAGGRVRARYSWMRNTFWSYEICHPTVFLPPGFARQLGGFDDGLQIAADYKLTTAAGRIAKPFIFPRVIALQLEGGISDTRTAESLLETHLARVDILGLRGAARRLDRMWTSMLIVRSRARRRAGRVLRRLGVSLGDPEPREIDPPESQS